MRIVEWYFLVSSVGSVVLVTEIRPTSYQCQCYVPNSQLRLVRDRYAHRRRCYKRFMHSKGNINSNAAN